MSHNNFFFSLQHGNHNYNSGFSHNLPQNFGGTGWGRGSSTGWGNPSQTNFNYANQSPGRSSYAPAANGWGNFQNPQQGFAPPRLHAHQPPPPLGHLQILPQPVAAPPQYCWPRAEGFEPEWRNDLHPPNNPPPNFQNRTPSVISCGYPAEIRDRKNDPNWGEYLPICPRCGLPFHRASIVAHERECLGPPPAREFLRATRYSGGFGGL